MFCLRKTIQTNVEIVKYDLVTNITDAVLTSPCQQYNNSDRAQCMPTSFMAGMRTVQEMKQSLDNTCELNTEDMILG